MASSDAHKTVMTAQLWGHSPFPYPWGWVTVGAHCCSDCITPRLSTTLSGYMTGYMTACRLHVVSSLCRVVLLMPSVTIVACVGHTGTCAVQCRNLPQGGLGSKLESSVHIVKSGRFPIGNWCWPVSVLHSIWPVVPGPGSLFQHPIFCQSTLFAGVHYHIHPVIH